LQKDFVEVNEKGTEAAAVTWISFGAERIPEPPFEMIVNRPFIFAICDDPSGAVVFPGAVVDPTAR
jgi:serine protease inhibitor